MAYRNLIRGVVAAAALAAVPWTWGDVVAQSGKTRQTDRTITVTDAAGRKHTRIKKVTQAEREAAANRLKARILKGTTDPRLAAQVLALAALVPPAPGATGEYLVGPNGQLIPDVSGLVPNYANSPMPDFVDATCAGLPGKCGIRKFVDSLPGLDAPNNLGQYIPIAVAQPWPLGCAGEACTADYYEIELGEYAEQMHSDLPPTTMRGYRQTNIDPVPPFHYLGPLIIAQRGRPVRVKFTNSLPTGAAGDLFIPVDTTVMGAGAGPEVNDATRMTTDGQLCTGGVKTNCYTQNRATIHLHGGVTPWISDGTTHQWITPAGEGTQYPNGVSVYNVPDMPAPGKPGSATNPSGSGSQTFYYTNDQSARLMFYHDHAHGITRLNVYGGEAAGYLITDATEQALIADGGPLASLGPSGSLLRYGIPLVIQDKTFVDARTIGYQDPTWSWGTGSTFTYTDSTGKSATLRTPRTGDLWWPHVYQPAQNPYDITGTNAMGRWVYGPWFWPPTNNIAFKEIANPYYDCDQFGLPIPPATECRDWQPNTIPGTPNPSVTAEAFFDTPVVNGTAYPYVNVPAGPVRFRILNASHDRFWNLSLFVADDTGFKTADGFATEVRLNPAEVTAAKVDPTVFPTPVAAPGPSWTYIGTEGGFLPMPVVIPPQVTTWVTDPTVFNAGNVDKHSLLLGPAERADVIVDFTAFAGQTLILYNDAPAAFPARDPRFDYYTDNADLTETGGVAPVQPGYGPNTRTVMQIRVGAGGGAPFDVVALNEAFAPTMDLADPAHPVKVSPGVFESGQDPVVVGQTAYNEAYGNTFPSRYPCWGVARIQDTSMCVQPVTGQGPLYLPLQPKAIHDEMGASFDEYGRMSTNLGLELPFTQVGNQNFVLQSYSDPPTELVNLSASAVPIGDAREDGTQIWKVTHNGVDTHPVHFHLFHVQLINRVGWDGGIRLPHPTELGWKDTVRISPLEDTIVALRPIAPTPDSLPWELPNSIRRLEPALAPNSVLGFTNLDPQGNAVTVTNIESNFGWEYIWHCHILSHEEHDMMRAIAFAVPPKTPALTGSITGTNNTRSVVLTWTDSLVATSFTIEKASDPAFTQNRVTIPAGRMLTYSDRIGGVLTPIFYRVFASNTVGSTVPGYPTITRDSAYSNTFIANNAPPAAPTNLTVTMQGSGGTGSVRLLWTDNANNETSYVVERATDGVTFVTVATLPANSTQFTGNSLVADNTYTYRVLAVNGVGSAASNTVAISATAPNAPSNVLAVAVRSGGSARVTLTWTDNSNNETAFKIQRATSADFTAGLAEFTVNTNVVTFAQTVSRGVNYYYRVLAENPFGSSAWVNASPFPILTP